MNTDQADGGVSGAGIVLGGGAWPIGWSVGFVEAPLAQTNNAVERWREEEGLSFRVRELDGPCLLDQLAELEPLGAPHSRRLLVETTGDWTAYFDNALSGGDPSPWVGVLSEALGCRGVVATHMPVGQYPYPTTQFELVGPRGEGPLRVERTVSAGIFDEGRWRFEEYGSVQPFEEPALYAARRVKDRFPRALLVRYLECLGIHIDDRAFFGRGLLFEDPDVVAVRSLSIAQARAEFSE